VEIKEASGLLDHLGASFSPVMRIGGRRSRAALHGFSRGTGSSLKAIWAASLELIRVEQQRPEHESS